MKSYILAVSLASGGLALAVCVYLAFRLYRKRNGAKDSEYSQSSIVLTSTSAIGHRKRSRPSLHERAASQEKEDRSAILRRKEKRQEIKSMWLPKRKESLPTLSTTLVQPMRKSCTQDDRAQLSFTLHYKYQYASKSSTFLVKLIKAENLQSEDGEPLDVFIKTQLAPSRKQVFVSRVHRQTANPAFNEQYEFDISYQELQAQRLLFLINSFDCFSRHKTIGEVRITLAELGTHGFNILREISLCMHVWKQVSQ